LKWGQSLECGSTVPLISVSPFSITASREIDIQTIVFHSETTKSIVVDNADFQTWSTQGFATDDTPDYEYTLGNFVPINAYLVLMNDTSKPMKSGCFEFVGSGAG